MTNLEFQVDCTVKNYHMLDVGDTIVVGVSGGADSVALLHVLCKMREHYDLNLICAHLNHGIRGDEAQRDTDYVESLCRSLSVKCITCYKDIPAIASACKMSEELAGRQERYSFFEKVLKDAGGGKIAVAHNKNDSVETVLIKLTRGCSLNGLRGIAPVNGNVIRPLIQCDRADIELYLEQNSVQYMTDSTNSSNIYTRNIIRNKVVPILKTVNPGFINIVYTNSLAVAEDDDFIAECCKFHTKQCVKQNKDNVIIDLNYIRDLHICLKKRIILYAVSILNGSKADIEYKHLAILCGELATGNEYHLAAGIKAYVEYNNLVICKSIPQVENYEFNVNINSAYNINNKCINFELTDNNDIHDTSFMYISLDNTEGKRITLRNRRDGDRFHPSGMVGSKKLKSYFIDCKIPQSVRSSIPLLCIDDEIAAVIGHRVSSKFVVNDKTKKILKITFSGGTNE